MSAGEKRRSDTAQREPDAEAHLRTGSGAGTSLGTTATRSPDPAKLARAEDMARTAYESMTDEEDDAIAAAALSDPDTPLLEEVLERNERRRLGRPPLPRTKRSVHLRLDQEVVDFFVKDGPGWQTRINAALRKAAGLK